MKKINLYTDGACSGNPGPGGWGAILVFNGTEKEFSGGTKNTTNNQMELLAVIEGTIKSLTMPSSFSTLGTCICMSMLARILLTNLITALCRLYETS